MQTSHGSQGTRGAEHVTCFQDYDDDFEDDEDDDEEEDTSEKEVSAKVFILPS